MAYVTFPSAEQDVRATSDPSFRPRLPDSSEPHQQSKLFNDWFLRSRGALYSIACRVLGGTEGAEVAIQNCWLRASRNPPTFDREGAFRSWLLRILIDRL
jgi:DNA-directed RNA polymerase specialized sigma24 family protein